MENAEEEIQVVKEEEPSPKLGAKSVKTKVPEIEVHLFRRGKGPVDVFKSTLGGWDRDQLEVLDILDKYGFKSLYAFNTQSGRGVPVRFNPKNGRSLLTYTDGSVVYIDGEPKDSLIKPITRTIFGLAVLAVLLAVFVKETPEWFKKSNFLGNLS
ncbi:hypothetical protein H6P81_003724 [Aristolochia fimbriata]|uniref:Uncharacterized protein n=1 Tax=Aristolochia fimbriata TaxID=158543 RepID=A0AAV7FEG5_ARIFI|nr:hypothetical protein H6P81_003724 [Aristolochia fimbriata]